MIITLATIQQSSIPTVLGLCPTDPRVTRYANEAQERLMSTEREWLGTWQTARFVIIDGCIVWPRGVLEIRHAKIGCTPMSLRNSWYEYVQPVGDPGVAGCGNFVMQDNDWSPVVNNVDRTGNTIRFFPGGPSDYGKRILVQGYDINHVFVRSQSGSSWVDGEYVTLASPFVDTVNTWYADGITGIQKDITDQPVTMFDVLPAVGSGEETTTEMATLEPDESYPRYKRSKILNFDSVVREVGGGWGAFIVECIVKRGHIPIRVPTDYLVLQNLAAIKSACMAIKREEDEGPGAGEEQMAAARRLLSGELRNVLGRKTHITADLHGGRTFSRSVMAGMR